MYVYIYIRIDFFPADVVLRGTNLSFRLRYHSRFFPHDQSWWISAAKDMKETQSDMDSATSMLEKADSKKDKLEATAKVLGWLMETEGCFGAIFFTGWSRKQRVMVRILSGPICSGDGVQYGSNMCRNRDAARSRRLQPDCRLPCSCRRNEELPGQPRWDCSGVAVRSGHVKKRVAFSTFSPSAGHIIRSFRLNHSAKFHQISTFVFKHSSRVLSTYQPSAPTDFVFPLLWAIQLWSDVLNSRHRLR